MTKTYLRMGALALAASGFMLLTGCVVDQYGRVYSPGVVVAPPVYVAPRPVYVAPPPPPPVYVAPPTVYVAPPAVEVTVGVPDDYTWDGYEYVGFVGGGYVYLGAGNVWLACEPFRLERFHGWERGHPDWRVHAIRNDRFRNDRNGHFQPRHDDHGHNGHDDHDHGH